MRGEHRAGRREDHAHERSTRRGEYLEALGLHDELPAERRQRRDHADERSAAPGLHGAGKSQSAWLAIAIAGAALMLALSGSLLERHRPQMSP